MLRIDSGQRLLSLPEVTRWLDAAEADADVRERVSALAEAALGETRPWRDLVGGEVPHLQGDAAARESAAESVRNFQPTLVPGLLQTAEYARQVLRISDIAGQFDQAAALTARLDRQSVLHEEGRRFAFLLGERALRWSPAPGALAAQLDRLVSLATLDTVAIGVLPDARVVGRAPWHNFAIWSSPDAPDYVMTELVHGVQEIHDPETVALYVTLWDELWSAAATGSDALELVRAAATA